MSASGSAPSDDFFSPSRRQFMKGAGAMSVTPLLLQSIARGDDAIAERRDDLVRMSADGATISLRINDQSHALKVEPRETLLQVLRDRLEMTGSKEVCSRGACGGCTVMVDGEPVNSCLMLAVDAVGTKITTIEGLAKGDKLDAVQDAFVKHDAMQCGFCTPGFIMSLRALLNREKNPSVARIKESIAGNICRCGTYNRIFDAAQAASGLSLPVGNIKDNADKAWENEAPRVDAVEKVTGRAKYTADVGLPKMAYGKILYCPYGKAKLASYSEKAARRVKGVLAVSVTPKDEYIYSGQPTGYVCAETPQAVDDAVAALALKWDSSTPSVDPVEAHQRDHGPIPAPIDSVGDDEERNRVKEALDKAKRVLERTYRTQVQTHTCLEPHGTVADYRGDTARIWCSTQGTSVIHANASRAFGLDRSKVHAHCEYVGGGFGSKFGIDIEGRTACELSKKLNRPVKIINDRHREHLDTGCRPGSIQYMKFAQGEDGLPTGGYVYVVGINGPGGGGDAANPSRYQFGSTIKGFVDLDLNIGGARAMRAPGHPQGMFAVDSFVDELAAAAGMDPLAYRRKIDPNPIRKRMYDVGAERIGWSKRPTPDGSGKGRVRRGIGMACADWGNRKGHAQIRIDVFKDGTVRVLSGTQDIGTGTRTVLVDTVAEHLDIDRSLISSDCGNSDYPPGPPSGGSVTARTIVPAIRDTAEKARQELKKLAEVAYSDTKSWKAACSKLPQESLSVTGSFNDDYWGEDSHSEAVQFAEVEVDTETGVVRVTKVVALQNCGQPVNRLTAEHQIIGAVLQGASFALFEEKVFDPQRGAMLNPNVEEYKILGPKDVPEIVPILWHEGENLGVRSLGEPPVIPTAGAIGNAVANAIGARVRELPITPARVLAALAEKGEAS